MEKRLKIKKLINKNVINIKFTGTHSKNSNGIKPSYAKPNANTKQK